MWNFHPICLLVPPSSVSLSETKAFGSLYAALSQWHVDKIAYSGAALKALTSPQSFWWDAMLI